MVEIEVALGGIGRKVQFWMQLEPTQQPDAFLLEHFNHGLCFEPEILWVLLHTLQEGDRAIDVGANIGFFTMLMSCLVGESGHVLACEPGSNNLPTLRWHLKRNKIFNVEIDERPVWSKAGPIDFYLNPDDRSSNALFDPAQWDQNIKAKQNPQKLLLDATTLDDLAGGLDCRRLKVIKIDTEGADQRVLEGASNLFEMYQPPFVIVELNPLGLPQTGCTAETMRDFMASFGYDMFFLHQNDLFPTLVPATTRVTYLNDVQIINVLFSTMERVSAAWTTAVG